MRPFPASTAGKYIRARELASKPSRTGWEDYELRDLLRYLTGHDCGLDGSNMHSSSRIGPGRPRHYSIVRGGLCGGS